jgi:hypothetical protein
MILRLVAVVPGVEANKSRSRWARGEKSSKSAYMAMSIC